MKKRFQSSFKVLFPNPKERRAEHVAASSTALSESRCSKNYTEAGTEQKISHFPLIDLV